MWVVSCLGFRVGGLGFRLSVGGLGKFRVQGVGCSQQVGDFTSSDTQDTGCRATLATPLKPGVSRMTLLVLSVGIHGIEGKRY